MSYNDITSGIDTQPDQKKLTPAARFKQLDGKRTSILNRCEDYARWTLPYIFTRSVSQSESEERTGPADSIGAACVNSLANKIVMSLFPQSAPFIRLVVADDTMNELRKAAKEGDKESQVVLDTLDEALATAEKNAMRELDYTHYRTEATTAAKSLIITGNALLYHPEGEKGKVQCYSLKDYVVVRDLNGHVIEFITRDTKELNTFSPELQEKIKNAEKGKLKHGATEICLYTQLKLGADGRYHMTQSANDYVLDTSMAWPKAELPWIVLTWNLARGENYGRGLVEDFAGAFHGLDVLTNAFVDAVGAAADIKWLVNPASVLDVAELNKSDSGSYHSGMKDDVSCVQVDKAMDLTLVRQQLQDWKTQLGQAFLVFTSVRREGERVTAEEIRATINDLESQHGGIYSRFSSEWQYPTAVLMLNRVKINIGKADKRIYPVIITGLDSLSRAGDMENFRLMVQDLATLNELPESVLAALDGQKVVAYVGVRRGVDYKQLLKTQETLRAEQQQEQAQQEQVMAAQANANVAEEAGKQAFQQQGQQ